MPVLLASESASRDIPPGETIEIGFLNNIGDGGLEAGEAQIVDLLTASAAHRTIRLHLFSLSSLVRSPDTLDCMRGRYADLRSLRAPLDGLFVTGCEPCMPHLRSEVFWPELAQVIDWADHNTISTIWSCLAAHAAVLHLDAIERHRLPEKCSGVFEVARACDHTLLDGIPDTLEVCHSRYNGLAEADLVARGYDVLTRSPLIGVDTFAKRSDSLFVFFQGHPEYDLDALRREYRRDVMRFLSGASEDCPHVPADYFDHETERALRAFESQAKMRGDPALAARFPLKGRAPQPRRWNRDFAIALMRNWLEVLRPSGAARAQPKLSRRSSAILDNAGVAAAMTPVRA